MGGGKGGGGSRQSGFVPQSASSTSPELEAFTKEIRTASAPVRSEIFQQVAEALRTGGVGAQIPMIQRSVEASRSATSQTLRGLDEQFARGPGFAGSEFAQRIRALTSLAGAQETAAIPTNYAKQLTDIAPALASGAAQTTMGGLVPMSQLGLQSTIARQQVEAQRAGAKGGQDASTLTAIVGMAAAAASMMCWVADALYGPYSRETLYARVGVVRWPWLMRWTYRHTGRWVARRPWCVTFLRPLFDRAVRRGR